MAAVTIDTHALVWYVEASPLLSGPALTALQVADSLGEPIYVSSVSLVEIAYLVDKGKLAVALLDRIVQLIRQGQTVLTPVPFTFDMAETLRGIPRNLIPDMPDRMIAATAVTLGVPLVSRDQRIHSSGVPTIW